MAENTKKFLDFTGLQKYDKLLKDKVAADIKVVQDDLDTRKVKDTADSTTITWSKVDGTYTASVKGDVVVDAEYQTVKTKATQSAAAWTKFLNGSNVAYPDGITPELKDLATTESVNTKDAETLASAKSYADGLAVNYDSKGSAAQALVDAKKYTDGLVKDAEGNVKFDEKGAAEAAKTAAIKAAKDYADATFDRKGSAATAEQNAKDYADGLASNYDAAGSADQALKDAKSYADGKASTAESNAKSYADGVAATAKSEAISEANSHTNTEIAKVNEAISSINTSIAGGVHFIGISTTEITDKGIQTPTIEGWAGPVRKGDIVINNNSEEFIWDGARWQKLGDTTQESQRITALEGHVNTLIGGENTTGSVAKALKDAKTFTTSEITKLVTSGKVKENADAIAILRGADTVEGSVAKALKDAKAYADTKKKEATDYTDTKISDLVKNGQVGKNTAAIATLNAGAQTAGSVDYKIAQAVSNIEASIDTIPESDINSLFRK